MMFFYCENCGGLIDEFGVSNQRRFCGNACRQAAYRSRRKAERMPRNAKEEAGMLDRIGADFARLPQNVRHYLAGTAKERGAIQRRLFGEVWSWEDVDRLRKGGASRVVTRDTKKVKAVRSSLFSIGESNE